MKRFTVGLAALLLTASSAGCGGSSSPDRSTAIGVKIGARTCEETSFEITNKLDGSKTRIYDCSMPSGKEKCVTEEGGVAHDSTEEVKLLFQSTLGEAPPNCVG